MIYYFICPKTVTLHRFWNGLIAKIVNIDSMSAFFKRIVVLSLLYIGLAPNSYGQSKVSYGQAKVDSLNSKLEENLSDSARVFTLIAISEEYQYIDLQKSFDYVEKAIKLSEEKGIASGKAKSYRRIGNYYSIRGDFVSSTNYHEKALATYYQLKDSSGIASSHTNMGINYSALGKYDEAFLYQTQSYQIATLAGHNLERAIALHNIGIIFKDMRQYGRAIEYFKLAMKLSDEINDPEGAPYNYSEIGSLYLDKGNYDSALSTLKLSLKLARETRLKINELEPNILMNIAKTYLLQNNDQAAINYYDSAYALFQKTGNKFGTADVGLGRGLVFMKEKKYEEARKQIEQSAVVAHQLHARKLEIECYQSLSSLFESKGDFQKSLSFYKKSQSLTDSIFSESMRSKLMDNQILFETESKEAQIKALTEMEGRRVAEINRQELIQNILVVAMALSVILLFAVYRSGQRKIKINKLLIEHQEEMKKRSIELEQLNQVKDKFFSIISHDLRSPMNALGGILNLMDKGNNISQEEFSRLSKELKTQFNHTKTLINNLLDWALLQMDKLKIQREQIDLFTLVDSNATLVTSLQVKEVKVINNISPSAVAMGDTNMINLVMRNLMTNAIKFSETGAVVEVSAREEGDDFVVSVKDHGVGINPDVQKLLFEKTSGYSTRGTANKKSTGLGLILCKEFVERNGGKIWFESELGKGSTFYFTVKKAS
jgi:signal transduction histidine kinase